MSPSIYIYMQFYMFTSKFKYVNILAEAKPRLAQSLVHMQVFIFFLNESSPLEINFGLVELKKKLAFNLFLFFLFFYSMLNY